MKRIANAEYAEIIIPASNSRSQFFFPDLPNLRGRKLDAMEFYSNQVIGITNSGYTPVGQNITQFVSVTLYYNSGEYVVMPLARFQRAVYDVYLNNDSSSIQQLDATLFDGQVIVWTKSYITINSGAVNFSNQSFAFNIYYR
jgi:hypothetical protein